MEALIGAVAADSDFDWEVLENVIDRLLCIQLTEPDRFLKKTHYEMLNSWHQKHYGRLPDYEIDQLHTKHGQRYQCTLRFSILVDHDCTGSHRIDAEGETRSLARERAAYEAYAYLVSHGLWINLKDAHLVPSLEHSINQLQELYQKGYTEQPVYEYKALNHDQWQGSCLCSGINVYGTRYPELIINMAKTNDFISRADVIQLLHVDDNKAYRLLKALVDQDLLEPINKGRYAKYRYKKQQLSVK